MPPLHVSKSRFKSPRELRKFGMVMTVPLLLLAGLLYWRKGLDEPAAFFAVAGAAAFFLFAGLLVPRLLAPIEWAWMKLALVLSWVMTRVVLTLTFFLMIMPIGLLMRLLGRDPIERRKDPAATTYWVPVEPDGPGTRPWEPF